MVVERAHQKGRKVGLCGQAPSDDPDFARLLAEIGLDSVSVTSDALAKVVKALAMTSTEAARVPRPPAAPTRAASPPS
jgi:pyruvate,water dikinase